jgi:osmotically-inducible protein OsmY
VVKDSSISVESVNKGVVLLAGKAKSLDAHLRAVEIARKVPGVHRVSSEVTVEGTN